MVTNTERIQFLIAQEDGITRLRLPALYSYWRDLRSTNPEGYAANVAAWRRGLTALVRAGLLPGPASSAAAPSLLVLTGGTPLFDALVSDRYGRPLILDTVIREAVQHRDFVPLRAFLRAKKSIYSSGSWGAWAAALPWTALSWGWRQLTGGDGDNSGYGNDTETPRRRNDDPDEDRYVVLANVEAAANAFAERTANVPSRFAGAWSVAHFKRVFSQPGALFDDGLGLSDTDLDVLLVFLARDRRLIAYDGAVVVLQTGRQSQSGPQATPPGMVTDADRAAAQVRELMDALSHQTDVLSRRIDDLAAAAADALARRNRVAALAALRLKKQTGAVLATRYASLAQLEAVAARLEQAADNVQLVQAMAASADALEALNAQTGGAARVEDVVGRLRSQMDAADEIGLILSEAPSASAAVDADAIDDELAALEKQEQKQEQEQRLAAQKEAQEKAALETEKRLAAAGSTPTAVPSAEPQQTQTEQSLEDEATESLRNLALDDAAAPLTAS